MVKKSITLRDRVVKFLRLGLAFILIGIVSTLTSRHKPYTNSPPSIIPHASADVGGSSGGADMSDIGTSSGGSAASAPGEDADGSSACVTRHTLVATKNEANSIIDNVRIGDEVLGMKSGSVGFYPVLEILVHAAHDHPRLVRIITESSRLELTPNHHLMTNRGWQRADSVTMETVLMRSDGNASWQETVKKVELATYEDKLLTLRTEADNYFANGILIHTEAPRVGTLVASRIKQEAVM
jgi:hypothetical protein